MKKKKRIIILALLGAIVTISVLYISLFMDLVRVPTGSMKNTIMPGDRLAANKLFKEIRRGDVVVFRYPRNPSIRYLQRVIAFPGETVELRRDGVFINAQQLPEHSVYTKTQDPSDTSPLEAINEIRNPPGAEWTVYYSEAGEEDFVIPGNPLSRYGVGQPYRIPVKGDPVPETLLSDPSLRQVYDRDADGLYDDDQYFCLSDNRDNSMDSRYWGTVPRRFVLSKAAIIYWSSDLSDEDRGSVRWDRVFKRVR